MPLMPPEIMDELVARAGGWEVVIRHAVSRGGMFRVSMVGETLCLSLIDPHLVVVGEDDIGPIFGAEEPLP